MAFGTCVTGDKGQTVGGSMESEGSSREKKMEKTDHGQIVNTIKCHAGSLDIILKGR